MIVETSDLADSHSPAPSLPQHKHSMYLDRLLLVQQRLRRNPLFQSANLILPGSGGAHTAHVRSSRVMTQRFLILNVWDCPVCSLSWGRPSLLLCCLGVNHVELEQRFPGTRSTHRLSLYIQTSFRISYTQAGVGRRVSTMMEDQYW